MARDRVDGVIETVRYTSEELIDIVRVYERRGSTFSDRVLLTRDDLINRIRSGQKYATGTRTPYLASTFTLGKPVQILKEEEMEYLVTGSQHENRDLLNDLPVF